MNQARWIGVALLALVPLGGCVTGNRIVANKTVQSSRWYGELGITGHLNEITVQSGSNLTKLSIIGNFNTVHVMDHVRLGKVEIWGQDNKVYIPQGLLIRESIIGHGSEIVRVAPSEPQPRATPTETFQPEPPPEEVKFEPATEEPIESAEPTQPQGQSPSP